MKSLVSDGEGIQQPPCKISRLKYGQIRHEKLAKIDISVTETDNTTTTCQKLHGTF